MSLLRTASLIVALAGSTSVFAADASWRGLAEKTPAASPAAAPVWTRPAAGDRGTAGTAAAPMTREAAAVVRAPGLGRKDVVAKPAAPVDENALRYYAGQNDTARVAAEIRRLKSIHPSWEPPQDLFEGHHEVVDEQQLWALFAEGRFEDIRTAVMQIQEQAPNWRPSTELVNKVEQAESRNDLTLASNSGDHARVLAIAEERPGLLVCTEMDVLWRVAESLVQTSARERAFDLYRFILTNCSNNQERLATVQKASVLLNPAMTERLIALGGRPGESGNAFEAVRLDLLRKKIGETIGNPAGEVNVEDARALETYAEQKRSANDAILIGWLRYSRKDWPAAANWFKKAMGWESQPKAIEGYALALRQHGQLAEAERVSYDARKADPLIEQLYIEILATELTRYPAPSVEPVRLSRFEQVAEEAKSVTGSQALGWYHYNQGNTAQAETWFGRSVAWEPIESNVLGLALSAHKLKKTALFKSLIKDHGTRFPAVAGLSKIEVATASPAPSKARRSKGGGGGGGGGASGRLAQEAVELYKKGQYAQALATLDRRASQAREDEGLGLLRGWSLYHTGQFQQAKDHFSTLDARRSTKDTQYGKFYSNERMIPSQFRAD